MNTWLGKDVPKLGMGMMRLPLMEGASEVDIPQVEKMIDAFIANGFTYIDTAYGYLQGKSEEITGRTVVDRYPRSSFLLATKLPPWELKQKEDMQRVFDTQLARTHAEYFDYYLIHSISSKSLEQINEMDVWGFMRKLKEEGRVRHIGFSFHDSAEVLDTILTEHPEMEFVQLQINYADWEDPKVQSRLCYEVARKHHKSVVVMEPVKGGMLAGLTQQSREVLETIRPNASSASWAMRYAASLDGIITVLSGMSSLSQMADNIATFANFEPITEADRQALAQVQRILKATPTIPCTNCKYCTEKCPQDIPIPNILSASNRHKVYGFIDKGGYVNITQDKGKASDCIACGVCEGRCPQHIKIIDELKACADIFEV